LRLAKWWVSEGMVDPSLHQALKCVEPLKRGRCDCPEAEPVKPVDPDAVEKTLCHLPPVLQDLVKVQALLGCRPGEIVKLTPSMVDQSGKVWTIRLTEHKTSWRGHDRTIFVGPKAQAILATHLLSCKPDEVIFSPVKATQQRLSVKAAQRKTPLSCGNKPGSNKVSKPKKSPGVAYTTQSYGKAIAYAAKRAGVDVWSPNQLRHAKATELRTAEGIESASLILGHKSLDVTQVYAEKSEREAIKLAVKYG
jgi:integrase